MNIYIDIDGTTAYTNVAVYIRLCNELLRLAIADELLATVQTVEAFEALPEVQRFRARFEEQEYQHMIEIIGTDPRHAVAAKVMSGAQAGVAHLAAYGSIGYCTARSGFPWDDALHEATYQWLSDQQFIQPTNVIFCESPLEKLRWVAKQLDVEPQMTILIDDSWHALMDGFQHLESQEQLLLEHSLILGAFRAKDQDMAPHPLRIIPFPRWSHVDQFVAHLHQVC